ncbi:MAG: DUF1003 domain-containing protein [Acidobacteria bacterium]|nr:DUF1003 domain-containing protein [Acidobacteriota bacterium]
MKKNHFTEFVKNRFPGHPNSLTDRERRVLHHLTERRHISRNIGAEFEQRLTFGQKVSDRVAAFGGSWGFIFIFCSIVICWVLLNSYLLAQRGKSFDPYPFILLNLFLSMLAALQAPVILMSQNRQAAKDRMDAAHDYEVNLKAELEIMALHDKLDGLRDQQWGDLVSQLQEQKRLLEALTGQASEKGRT